MRVLLSNKVSKYIDELPENQHSSIIDKLRELGNKSKSEILKLENIIDLSENESIKFYAYFIDNATYAVFAFRNKNNIIVVDLIELIDNRIKSLTITPEEAKKIMEENQ